MNLHDTFEFRNGFVLRDQPNDFLPKPKERNFRRGFSAENKSVSAERATFCQKILISAESGPFRPIFHVAVTLGFGQN